MSCQLQSLWCARCWIVVLVGKVMIHIPWKWLESSGNLGNTYLCSIQRWAVRLSLKLQCFSWRVCGHLQVHVCARGSWKTTLEWDHPAFGGPGTHQWASLASQDPAFISSVLGLQVKLPRSFFLNVDFRAQLRSSCLHSKYFSDWAYQWSCLPNPPIANF